MQRNRIFLALSPIALSIAVASQAQAAVSLYDQNGTSFSVDGHFNTFLTHTDNKQTQETQTRVRMGFLPNYIGFNVSKQSGDLTLGGRSSFWVTINDGSNNVTDTAIDVRQFYATVDGSFGQVLFGKDFGIYARSNVFNDELLFGTGLPMQNSGGVTFGNISTGYPYAVPKAQLTYRTNDMNGLKVAVSLLDPQSGEQTAANTDNSLRVEAEATYAKEIEGAKLSAWVGVASGKDDATDVDASGVAYGVRVAMSGFQATVSGFDQKGISTALADRVLATEAQSDGMLVQGSYATGATKFVLSYGETETGGAKNELTAAAVFYDVNESLKLVAEYDVASATASKDTTQLALGASFSW